MHDAKAVVVLAKLHAIRKGTRYEPQETYRRDLRSIVDRRDVYADTLERHYGRLEGLLARHWPELTEVVKVRSQRSWMALLNEQPGPESVAQSPERAEQILKRASRGMLAVEHVEQIVSSARNTLGVPMTTGEKEQLRELVAEIQRLTLEQDRLDKELGRRVRDSEVTHNIAKAFGPAVAGVVLSYLGDPSEYGSAAALEKAAGLNLKVRSSGKHAGRLKLTKRGPGIVRRILHMAVLRLVQSDPVVQAWYRNRMGYQEHIKLKAVVAVTRKLIRAIWRMVRDKEPFDSSKLFDTRKLTFTPEAPKRPTWTAARRKGNAARSSIHNTTTSTTIG
jgi:transposase